MALRRTSLRAFTLIELLVVVAIIALLISILLPSLNRAREQGRTSVCLANMRSITSASVSYYMDHDDFVFTWPIQYWDEELGMGMGGGLYTEFIWGGDVPDATLADWDPDQGLGPVEYATGGGRVDILKFPPNRRPMNFYIDPDMSWSDRERVWWASDRPARTERASQAPAVFRCPSDKTCAVPGALEDNPPYDPDTPYYTWKNWGTSYPISWYWGYFYVEALAEESESILVHIAGKRGVSRGRGRHLLRSKETHGASEFIIFYENQMNYAMGNAGVRGRDGDPAEENTRNYTGWHKQKDYHVAGFFDGHAQYRRFDTRFIDGVGWTTWPNRDEWEKYPEFAEYADY